jgi:hypothetical protein
MAVVAIHRSRAPSLDMGTPNLGMEAAGMEDTNSRAVTTSSSRLAGKEVVVWGQRELLLLVLEVDCLVVCSLLMPWRITTTIMAIMITVVVVMIMEVVVMTLAEATSKHEVTCCFCDSGVETDNGFGFLGALIL